MSEIEQSVEVEAPLSAVYNQWTQFEEYPGSWPGSSGSSSARPR